jgi:D-sedoheptulose 7-phosphate isomerase
MNTPIHQAFLNGVQALQEFLSDHDNITRVEEVSKIMANCFDQGNKVIIFGNGGSACDAAHFAEEFTGRYRKARRALPVITVNDAGHITCVGNDYGFEEIFSRSVDAFTNPGDIVIGLSTSGNSENILRALNRAQEKGGTTIALLGKDGGKMNQLYDYQWIAPGGTSDRIQEIHMMILHIIIEGVERILFPENYS